jgi:TP901 family phage tail tape measure protein
VSRNYGGSMVANLFAVFGADTEPFQKSMRSAVTRMLFAAESFTQAGRIMSTAITAPMLAIGALAIKTALKFDESLTKINTLVGVSGEIVQGWRDQILSIASETGRAATELADAMFFITSNGIRGAAAIDTLRAAAQAAAVGLGETKEIAFAATSAMNAYGEGVMTAQEATAILVKTVREGNLEASQLPPVLGQVLPVAAAMKVSFNDVGAAIAAITRSGASAKIAALGVRSTLLSLLSPTAKAQKAMKGLDTTWQHVQETLQKHGLKAALDELAFAVGGNTEKLKALIPNSKALVAVLQLTGATSKEVRDIFRSLAETTGEDLSKAFEDTQKGPMQKYKEATANLNVALIELGQNLYPVVGWLASAAESARDAAKWFNDLGDTWKGVISTAAGLVLVVGPVSYAIGSLFRIMSRMVGLSILFKASWVRNVAGAMASTVAPVEAVSAAMTVAEARFTTSSAALKTTKIAAGEAAIAMDGLAASIGAVTFNIIAAFTAGYQFGKFLDEWLGITDKINEHWGNVGTTLDQLTASYESNNKLAMEQAASHAMLAEKIDAVEIAEALLTAAHNENYREVARLNIAIEQMANEYNTARIKIEGVTEAREEQSIEMKAYQEQIMADRDAEIAATKATKEHYDLLTGPEVKGALEELIANRDRLVKTGVKEKLVNEEMAEDLLKYLKLAKEYNLQLDDGVIKWAKTLNEKGIKGFEDLDSLLSRTFTHVDAQPGKIIEGMVKVGDEIAVNLKGGFQRGFADGMGEFTAFDAQLQDSLNASLQKGFGMGFDKMRTEMQKIVEETKMNPLEIGVYPNKEIWLKFFYDIASGKYQM